MPNHNYSVVNSPTEEAQEKLLDESLSCIKVQSFHMKCCLDKGKLMEALKHASNMLSELRTSYLSPKSYYELYMAVTDQLRHLELFLVDEFQKDNKIYELYELVQYAGNIIPRLYLLISVGLVYMKTSPACRKEILRDLVEMCRGVQHPLRGLFLRNYLLQTCRHVLPDTLENLSLTTDGVYVDENATVRNLTNTTGSSGYGSNSTVDGNSDSTQQQQTQFVGTTVGHQHQLNGELKPPDAGNVLDSIEFVLANFAEMNKLWVRMQHLGHTREKDRREKERLELRLLVGTNLVRLSQLESIDVHMYTRVVLPGILEQVVSCKDAIAQEYLMESLIQVFPDEFHLATLSAFLNSCAQLAVEVKVKNIIIALVDRLAASHDVPLPDDLFDIFSQQISHIITSRPSMPLEDIIIMQGSLVNFSLKKIPDERKREQSINSVLGATLNVIKEMNVSTISLRSPLGKEMYRFLKLPFNISNTSLAASIDGSNVGAPGNAEFGLIKMALKLNHFKELLKETTDIELHKQLILTLINATLENYCEDNVRPMDRLSLSEMEVFLAQLAAPLVNGASVVPIGTLATTNGDGLPAPTTVPVIDDQDEDFIDEQQLLSRFIHFLLLPQCIDASGSGEENTDDTNDNKVDNSIGGQVVDTVPLLDTTYLMFNSTRKILSSGGPSRMRHTYPPLVFEALRLAARYTKLKDIDTKWEKKCQKIYQNVNQLIVTLLKEGNCSQLCLRLFLESALNAAQSRINNWESIAYEFISQALAVYEEEISDSKEQTLCLTLIIATVKRVQFTNMENFEPLRNQCCLNCGKLVKKSDQCRAILVAASLFITESSSDDAVESDASWANNKFRRGKLEPEVLKCFRKCIKIATSLLDNVLQLQLYVEILSHLTLYVGSNGNKNEEVIVLCQQLSTQINERRVEVQLPTLIVNQYQNAITFLSKNGIDLPATVMKVDSLLSSKVKNTIGDDVTDDDNNND